MCNEIKKLQLQIMKLKFILSIRNVVQFEIIQIIERHCH